MNSLAAGLTITKALGNNLLREPIAKWFAYALSSRHVRHGRLGLIMRTTPQIGSIEASEILAIVEDSSDFALRQVRALLDEPLSQVAIGGFLLNAHSGATRCRAADLAAGARSA